MLRSSGRRRQLLTPLVLLIVLGVTTGWSYPASAGHGTGSAWEPVSATDLFAPPTLPTPADRALGAHRIAAIAAASERSMVVVAAGLAAHVYVGEQIRQRTAATAKPDRTTTTVKATTKPKYSGRNHFWIPSLNMSYQVYSYACSSTRYPANLIYRWGCAGRNNVYLLGHAYGVMKPLHDLYVRGDLRVGMIAVYADSSGRVRKYRVTSWQVVYPTEVEWAIASQPVPSMTLQTCVGANSAKRLNVRLVAVN